MKKFFQSLLARYMLIILSALIIVQAAYLLLALFAFIGDNMQHEDMDPDAIEKQWHQDAYNIYNVSSELIIRHFAKWKEDYPNASMFWVDGQGEIKEQVNIKEPLPSKWTASYTAKYIKERYGGDPFTVIAFVGKGETQGFVVLEIPRKIFDPPISKAYQKYGSIMGLGIILIILLFITVSFLFFRGIRKRLLRLQDAMEIRDTDGLPIEIKVRKYDEIGQLEKSFNQMVYELRESKQREQKEEQLRRELIANLSHDLRTPLTKIRALTYSISKENLTKEGISSIKALESSIVNIDRLIENLMSYTLLMASKYKFETKEVEIVRFVREFIAVWYPVFEKDGFEIDVDLQPFEINKWIIDPIWLGSILDNLLQNVVRHASNGQYIGMKTQSNRKYDAIVISDRGKGMQNESNEKGAGIGLSIVDMMIKGMSLDWEIDSSIQGTTIKIIKYK